MKHYLSMLAGMPAKLIATFVVMFAVLMSPTIAVADETPPAEPTTITEISLPERPPIDENCGPTNDVWGTPPVIDGVTFTVNEQLHMIVTATAPDTIFAGTNNQPSFDYGLATDYDTATACPVEPVPATPTAPTTKPVKWSSREKDCMAGVTTSGHRGTGFGTVTTSGRRYSEDTQQALVKGKSLGLCAVETDFWETRDGYIVSHHDGTLNRMTNCSGRIHDRLWRYVKKCYSPGPYGRAYVRSHSQVMRALARNFPNLCFTQQEIKGGALSRAALQRMVRTNARYFKAPECVMYTSSERTTLAYMNKITPRAKLGWINRSKYSRPALSAVPTYVDRIMLDYRAVNPTYVKGANARGHEVSARGVNDGSTFYRMKKYGVGYVVTDRPMVVRARR